MKKVYFTLTGTCHYYGMDFLKKGDKIKLIKEPDNEYDKEAIRVEYKDGIGKSKIYLFHFLLLSRLLPAVHLHKFCKNNKRKQQYA